MHARRDPISIPGFEKEAGLVTLADVGRADDDEVGDEGGESGGEAGLRHEAELELVEAHRLVVAPPIPSWEHEHIVAFIFIT